MAIIGAISGRPLRIALPSDAVASDTQAFPPDPISRSTLPRTHTRLARMLRTGNTPKGLDTLRARYPVVQPKIIPIPTSNPGVAALSHATVSIEVCRRLAHRRRSGDGAGVVSSAQTSAVQSKEFKPRTESQREKGLSSNLTRSQSESWAGIGEGS